MAKKRKFSVFFSQINQQRYEVEATNSDSAATKAAKLWHLGNGPSVIGVQEE